MSSASVASSPTTSRYRGSGDVKRLFVHDLAVTKPVSMLVLLRRRSSATWACVTPRASAWSGLASPLSERG
jgi:hypothetical protein